MNACEYNFFSRHPLDSGCELFLSFDYCHILKNIRSQFLEVKRLYNQEKGTAHPARLLKVQNNPFYFSHSNFTPLTFAPSHRLLYKIQEKQGAFKLVRSLTKKHLWPSNFEKMNVGRAIQVFSPQVKYAGIFFVVCLKDTCSKWKKTVAERMTYKNKHQWLLFLFRSPQSCDFYNNMDRALELLASRIACRRWNSWNWCTNGLCSTILRALLFTGPAEMPWGCHFTVQMTRGVS